jgi:hypothetical protein
MAFWIKYTARDGNGILQTYEQVLFPRPTEIDYPETRLYTSKTTEDGAVVVQRPMADSRPRKWTWKNYPSILPVYENQWKLLETLEYRTRLNNNLSGHVELWEDTSGIGGFTRLDGSGNRVYTKVKILQAHRTPRQGGGLMTYDESTLEFVVDDVTYTGF